MKKMWPCILYGFVGDWTRKNLRLVDKVRARVRWRLTNQKKRQSKSRSLQLPILTKSEETLIEDAEREEENNEENEVEMMQEVEGGETEQADDGQEILSNRKETQHLIKESV